MTFVDLVAATLRHGLVPIVVPELKTITIGGAVAGCSIESMSFRYGGFHDTCLEYEVITATRRGADVHARQRARARVPDDARLVRHARHPVEADVPARARRSRSCSVDYETYAHARRVPGGDPAALRARGRRLHGRHHPLARRARAVRRPVRRRGAVHARLRLDEGLLPEHARRGARTTSRTRGLLLPLRPRRHQRASEVVRSAGCCSAS